MSEFQVKDSGQRQQFASGMVRDVTEGKTNYLLIRSGPMFQRWAEHLTKGAVKYSEDNWLKAEGEAELKRFTASAARHFEQWLAGDRSEDHAAAVFFNLNGAEYVRDRMTVAQALEASAYRDSLKMAETPPRGMPWQEGERPVSITDAGEVVRIPEFRVFCVRNGGTRWAISRFKNDRGFFIHNGDNEVVQRMSPAPLLDHCLDPYYEWVEVSPDRFKIEAGEIAFNAVVRFCRGSNPAGSALTKEEVQACRDRAVDKCKLPEPQVRLFWATSAPCVNRMAAISRHDRDAGVWLFPDNPSSSYADTLRDGDETMASYLAGPHTYYKWIEVTPLEFLHRYGKTWQEALASVEP